MAFLGLACQARTVEKQGNTTHPQVDIMWLIGTKSMRVSFSERTCAPGRLARLSWL